MLHLKGGSNITTCMQSTVTKSMWKLNQMQWVKMSIQTYCDQTKYSTTTTIWQLFENQKWFTTWYFEVVLCKIVQNLLQKCHMLWLLKWPLPCKALQSVIEKVRHLSSLTLLEFHMILIRCYVTKLKLLNVVLYTWYID